MTKKITRVSSIYYPTGKDLDIKIFESKYEELRDQIIIEQNLVIRFYRFLDSFIYKKYRGNIQVKDEEVSKLGELCKTQIEKVSYREGGERAYSFLKVVLEERIERVKEDFESYLKFRVKPMVYFRKAAYRITSVPEDESKGKNKYNLEFNLELYTSCEPKGIEDKYEWAMEFNREYLSPGFDIVDYYRRNMREGLSK